MHELSMAENMLRVVLRYAQQNQAHRVTDLYLTVSDLASREALEFHWGQVSRGTAAEGAELHFEIVPTRLRCFACGEEYDYHPDHERIHAHSYECPGCQSSDVELTSGSEGVQLTSIDIEA